ncbi:MAG: hypothetical protein JSS11_13435, partial [Verrucomicrobia bacterium]|nr:hypothetical protein [Verrucomicrobiota bacterium]
MKTNHTLALLAGGILMLAAGCATTDTVDNRIKQNQAIYAGLTPEEQNQ